MIFIMKNLLLIVYFLTVDFKLCFGSLHCVDEDGKSVDWYVLYKLPKLKNNPDSKIAKGIAYAYITSDTVDQGWQLSKKPISDPESIPGRSLSFLFPAGARNEVNDYFWVFYNDEPPNEPPAPMDGHTKGIVAGDSEGGFWIVHSVPKFPIDNGTTYEYPKTGTMYGQSFLCISMKQNILDSVGNQLITNCAHVYNSSFTSELENKYPYLFKAARKERGTSKQRKELIHSVGNNQFLSFAKSDKFAADLYSDWVSSVLRSELYVESWLRDHRLPSACQETYRVFNVANVSFPAFSCKFGNFHDHSKYAVSAKTDGSYWVCIGDINRSSAQFVRGGGTVCMENQELWTAYHGMIAGVEPCPKFSRVDF